MKKLLVSFFVVFTFGFYVFYSKSKETSLPIIISQTQSVNPSDNASLSPPITVPPVSIVAPPLSVQNTPPVVPEIPPVIKPKGMYTDGEYIGSSADAYYGYIQVKAIIQNGKIINIQFLDHPQDRDTSISINNYAMPLLTKEAIQAQSANVDIISGATDTSGAFRESLAVALAKAKN